MKYGKLPVEWKGDVRTSSGGDGSLIFEEGMAAARWAKVSAESRLHWNENGERCRCNRSRPHRGKDENGGPEGCATTGVPLETQPL